MISAKPKKWPTKLIFIGEMDLDASYLHIHANATTALAFITIVDKIALLLLRLTFGTTPAPVEYTNISEAEIYIGNYLIRG